MKISPLALPITAEEFREALRSICHAARKRLPVGNRRLRLGLAVSGGVDSMALAALCTSYRSQLHADHTCEHVFTVDHSARQGSAEEALKVGQAVRELGLRHEILNVSWPDGVDPKKLPNFESEARVRRFRALGAAAGRMKLDALLFAHHDDDQAETTLQRLAVSRGRSGFRPMSSVANIPECWGMYGVHESGTPKIDTGDLNVEGIPPTNLTVKGDPTVGLEDGGILVCRPLLGFSKERLMATCRALRVAHFEDETNEDRTVTMRNTIRYLLEENRLPVALRKESLLRAARAKKEDVELLELAAQHDFKHRILSMDLRSGLVHVRFSGYLREPGTERQAAVSLRRVVKMVTPAETVSSATLSRSVNRLMPDGNTKPSGTSTAKHEPLPFTVTHVICAPVHSPNNSEIGDTFDPQWTWKISRQPLAFVADSPEQEFWPTLGVRPSDGSADRQSASILDWRLFDGRFWFQVENKTGELMILRLFKREDREQIASWPQMRPGKLEKALRSAALGSIRWTLPVFARKTGEVLAFPTLNAVHYEVKDLLRWRVRFKKIELQERQHPLFINTTGPLFRGPRRCKSAGTAKGS